MRKNDYTIRQLQDKIQQIMKGNKEYYLHVKDLESYDIYYTTLRKDERIYFLCNDGLCDMKLHVQKEIEEDYILFNAKIVKVQERDLENLAETLTKRNQEKIDLEKEIESLETIFQSQKLRGMFAKLKASK